MKAAYVCSDRGVPVFGTKGCSLHVQEISRAFGKRNIHPRILAAAIGGSPPDDLVKLSAQKLDRLKTKDRPEREQADIAANQEVITTLANSAPYDFVYERYSLWSHAGMTYAKGAGIPGILEVNAPLIEEQAKYRGLVDCEGAERISRQCFDAASLLIAVSKEVANYLATYTEAQGKVHVLPNGVNIERFAHVNLEGSNRSSVFTIGFVGTLKPWHGLEGLIAAFSMLHTRYPHARLLIVGDGPQADQIHSSIRAQGLDGAVEMTGAVKPADIPDYYARMDVGVAPYPADIDFYFSPLKIYEYMAAGLPVVASDIGQISELVEHQTSGLLYEASDMVGLEQAIEQLINNPLHARQLGMQARQIAVRNHSWDIRVKQILELASLEPPPLSPTGRKMG